MSQIADVAVLEITVVGHLKKYDVGITSLIVILPAR